MAKERITHSICVGGPLTIHTVDGVIRRVRPIVLTDDDAPGWVSPAHGEECAPPRQPPWLSPTLEDPMNPEFNLRSEAHPCSFRPLILSAFGSD